MNLKILRGKSYLSQSALIFTYVRSTYPNFPGQVLRRILRSHVHCMDCEHNSEYDTFSTVNYCCCNFDREILEYADSLYLRANVRH
jgi:hypothetical protein